VLRTAMVLALVRIRRMSSGRLYSGMPIPYPRSTRSDEGGIS
jgi:hypothetical protein